MPSDGSSSSTRVGSADQDPADGQLLLLPAGQRAGRLAAPFLQDGKHAVDGLEVGLRRPPMLTPTFRFSSTLMRGNTSRPCGT